MSRFIFGLSFGITSVLLIVLAMLTGDGGGAGILFVSLALAFLLAASVLLSTSGTKV